MKKLLLFIALLSLTTGINAQEEVTVKTFKELISDLSARTNRRYDLNDEPCALVKVQYPKAGATFEGSIVGSAEYKNGEYWVYISKGTKRIRIHLPEVPTIVVEFSDYGINQAESNTTYSIYFKFPSDFEASVYAQGGMLIGSTMGPEIAIGTYLSGFNIELCAMLPMASEQTVYWQNENQAPAGFKYKPSVAFGAKVGYGITTGNSLRITPQLGIRYMSLTETAISNSSLTPAKGANSAAITIGCKVQYMFTKTFGISLTPEYAAAVAKSKGFQALADVSSTIKGWNDGIGAKISVNVEF